MTQMLKIMTVNLLGLVLAMQVAFVVSAGPSVATVKADCCRSGCNSTHRSIPACCAKPAETNQPFTPAPPPSAGQNELQALAAVFVHLLTLPSDSSRESSFVPSSVLLVAAVPIFQRDCTYLL